LPPRALAFNVITNAPIKIVPNIDEKTALELKVVLIVKTL
jgi:hypothetical protein